MSELALLGGTPVLAEPLRHYPSLGEAEMQGVVDVMRSGVLSGFFGSPGPQFFGGPVVKALEAAWCQQFGVRHAISVNSGTSGLQAALGAIGLSPGDEVIVPPYTMSATAVAPLIWGGIPVFADVEDETFCIDVAKVEQAITPRTRAIIAVNLFGHPARVAELRALADRRGIWLIEDNAQAPLGAEHGRPAGTVGHIGVFSLNYHKHIHSGEGGVCVTNDDGLAQRMALIRNHGENMVDELKLAGTPNLIGFNFRLTEVLAAVALAQLKNIDAHVERRERVARILSEATTGLRGWKPPAVRQGCRHNFYMWTVRYDEGEIGVSRDTFSRALVAEGFPNEVGYIAPLYRLPVFRDRMAIGREGFPFSLTNRTYTGALCPVTERLYEREVLQYQPPSWDVDDATAERLGEAVRKVHRHAAELARFEAEPGRKVRRAARDR